MGSWSEQQEVKKEVKEKIKLDEINSQDIFSTFPN